MSLTALAWSRNSFAWREPLGNLLICAYMALVVFLPESFDQLRQSLLDESRRAGLQAGVSADFALLLLAVQGLEFIGLKWKSAAVYYRLQNRVVSLRFGLGIFVFWLFHMAVSLMLGVSASQAFDGDVTRGGGWTAGILLAVIGKEMVLLAFLLNLWGNDSTSPATQGWREVAADVLLFFFNLIAYTSLWEAFVFDPKNSLLLHWNHPLSLVIEATAAILLVCMMILPFKIPWLTEIWAKRAFDRTTGQAVLSLCLLFFVAINPLLDGEHELAQALHEPELVQRLFLSDWPGEHLPAEIERLQRLQVMVVQRSPLRSIPKQIGDLSGLTTLVLRQSQLAELPPQIGRLQQLQVLDVSNNRLQKLPQELESLHWLKELYLQGNPLSRQEIEMLRQKLPQTRILF